MGGIAHLGNRTKQEKNYLHKYGWFDILLKNLWLNILTTVLLCSCKICDTLKFYNGESWDLSYTSQYKQCKWGFKLMNGPP